MSLGTSSELPKTPWFASGEPSHPAWTQGIRESVGTQSSVFEDSPLSCFALGSSMSGGAELSLGLFHRAGHTNPFVQCSHCQAKSLSGLQWDRKQPSNDLAGDHNAVAISRRKNSETGVPEAF